MTRLSFNQRRALNALRGGPETTRLVCDGWFSHTPSVDVGKVLRRLEDRELVRRLSPVVAGGGRLWQLTDDGRDALEEA